MGSIEYFIRRNTEDEGKNDWNNGSGQYDSAVGSDSDFYGGYQRTACAGGGRTCGRKHAEAGRMGDCAVYQCGHIRRTGRGVIFDGGGLRHRDGVG